MKPACVWLAWVESPLGGHHQYWLVTGPGNSRLVAHLDGGGGLADKVTESGWAAPGCTSSPATGP